MQDWCNINKLLLSGFYNTCDDKTHIWQSSLGGDYINPWPIPWAQDGLHKLSVH